ncbi:SnoaL-like domain-containing protein [Massariosphaeria phaeospora]|uniref:SnoaL-like domain-containing protein n=1 Tax=Massariosphaeria phaeospora TaxID=100035 RepID=A0A7C8MEK5_9PLEO|nr:SnoaL-like domain-containing protein [Massariosphaeria phaeospora]
MAAVNPLDHIAIQNVLSRYCEALDTKFFPLLNYVFVPEVVADYPFNSALKGVDAVKAAIQTRLGPIKTHHSLTTQIITFSRDGRTANATTHFIGAHLGQGPHAGKVLSAYGKYIDVLVLLDANGGDYEGVQGASGIWRIKERTVVFTGRVGDESIMQEY